VTFQFKIPGKVLVTSSFFLGLFLFSFLLFTIKNFSKEKRLLFFPEHINRNLSGEVRTVVRSRSVEETVGNLVQEIILGPMIVNHARVFPSAAKIRSVVLRNKTAYLDFSADVLFLGEDVKISFEESVRALERAVLFNFPGISRIAVTIEGRLPGGPPFFPNEGKKRAGDEKGSKNR
jgi:hypothetical protein